MILAIDIGNTNIKLKAWNGAEVLFVKSFSVNDMDLVASYISDYSPKIVAVASVGLIEIENRISILFQNAKCMYIKSESMTVGVKNGYDEPDKLGVDRWLAAIEAFYESGGNACCVFDLGTAITLDVVDENGRHKGGYIVPGLTMMRESLLKSTQKVRYEPRDSMSLGYGANTADAVERGTLTVILAWIRSEINFFKESYPEGSVYLTGGGAKLVQPFLEGNVTCREDLVLDALKRIASD
jgi:type III pantothenate kinase